jgi:signal transduction histidine kinase
LCPNVILVVDDNPSNLQILFTCLEKAGHKILVAQNGENALKIAESLLPDLILLDVLMPGLDGFETCRFLKSNSSTQNIPVIFLTALSESRNKIQGFEVGGVDYITKPIEQREVLARIQTHLTLQKMQQHLLIQNEELQQEIGVRLKVESQLQERTFQLEKTLQFKGLLQLITEKIRDSLDERQILQTATKEIVQVLQIDSCQIELYDSNQTEATIAYEYSNNLPKCQGITRQIADYPEIYQQLLQKIPLQLVEKIPEFAPQGIRVTRLACPVYENYGEEGILGNLWMLRSPQQVFTDFEIQLVQQLAAQCAIAIRQARLYQASQRQVQELERLNRLKNDFLKTISHELRTPMSSIKLAAQTIEKLLSTNNFVEKSSTFVRVFQIFQHACQQQNQLVDDLLNLCYLDAKAEVLVFEWINLYTWIPEIVQPFIERAQEQKQHLIVSLPPQLPLLKTDISTLERILRELLNNACKYTPAEETIEVTVKANELMIELKVSNFGIEIPPEERSRIFEQFYRIPNNDPWQYGGTGLGLTLVKKLAELLEAIIEVKSENRQTTFALKFLREKQIVNC